MMKRLLTIGCVLSVAAAGWAEQPTVSVAPAQLQGSRAVEPQTETAVVRDYLLSWKSLDAALDQNRPALLDAYFVGTARDKLANTIGEQTKLGIHTRYVERAHNLQIVFYSPEGLSLQMTDTIEYDEQVIDHDKVLATKPMKQRYLVVLTPAETRWKVRILQAESGS